MKHHLRDEKICLNCGARVEDIYCPHCGQENIEPRESFGALLYHFFSDFTHFDSKLFTTLKYLVLRPGFLTREYLAGKRKRYLHPIRMYIFISFLFFLCKGLMRDETTRPNVVFNTTEAAGDLRSALDSLRTDSTVDTAALNAVSQRFDQTLGKADIADYATVEAYDSAQSKLSPEERASATRQYIERKRIKWKEKYGPQSDEMINEKLMHAIPKVMFLLLPLFALFLKWFYRKKHFYVDHAIFSLHFHSFAFLLMLISLLADHFLNLSSFDGFVVLILFVYLVLALRKMYQQSLIRSFFKGAAVSIMYLISIGIALAVAAIIVFILI